MNLHIHYNSICFKEKYTVYDDAGHVYYNARCDSVWIREINIYDLYNNKMAAIKTRLGLQPSRYMKIANTPYKLLTKPTLPPKLFCFIENTNYYIIAQKRLAGKFSIRIPKYWVYYGEKLIMYFEENQSQNKYHYTDMFYDLNIIDREHELMCLCIALSLVW